MIHPPSMSMSGALCSMIAHASPRASPRSPRSTSPRVSPDHNGRSSRQLREQRESNADQPQRIPQDEPRARARDDQGGISPKNVQKAPMQSDGPNSECRDEQGGTPPTNFPDVPVKSGEAPVEVDRLGSVDANQPDGKLDIKRDGVRLGMYATWIKDELTKEATCMELPFTIALLLAFTVMSSLHLRQDKVMIIKNAITKDIEENANFAWAHNFGHKGIEDVNSYADFWSWVRLGFAPLLIPTWWYSEDLEPATALVGLMSPSYAMPGYNASALPSKWQLQGYQKLTPVGNDYLRYNRIIGGIRFRQKLAKAGDHRCTFPTSNSVFQRWFNKPCVTDYDHGQLPPDLTEAEGITKPERELLIMTETATPTQVGMTLLDMEDGCASARMQNRSCGCSWCESHGGLPWLDEVTSHVEISFVIFNPVYGIYSYCGVNFWFNRAGHIYKLINIRSAWCGLLVRPVIEGLVVVTADTLWFVMCLYVVGNEVREIMNIINSSDKRWFLSIAEDYLEFWNLVDWISITLACTIAFLGAMLWFSTDNANKNLGDIAMMMTTSSSFSGEREQELFRRVRSFFSAAERMLADESAFRFQLVLYPSVLMMRLFKSFDAQERLAIVTKTFSAAYSDIFHFFIVFFSVYICMSVNAVLFFGQDTVDFSTLGRAFHSCFLAMFGDWDYDELTQIGRIQASLWFWMFQVVVVLVLQNIMLAILMDSYTHVKDATQEAMSLPDQVYTQYRRWQEAREGGRVRLNDIYDGLLQSEGCTEKDLEGSDKQIFPSEVMELVPNLKENQAIRTMRTCLEAEEKRNKREITEEDLKDNLKIMKDRLVNIIVCSEFLKGKVSEYDDMLTCATEISAEGCAEVAAGLKLLEFKNTDQTKPAAAVKKEDEMLGKREQSWQEGLMAVRHIAQQSTGELSESMAAVLAEEMGALERRQKEQQKQMEQMQSSLQDLRSLAYRLSNTCAEVAQLSASITPDQAGRVLDRGTGGEAPEVQVPAGALSVLNS